MHNLEQDIGKSIGNYNGLPVYVVSKNSYRFNLDTYQIVAETGELVRKDMVVGKMTGRREVSDLDKPRPYTASRKPTPPIPREEVKIEVPDPIIADVQLSNLIDETLKGKSLDDLLVGFNYGL